MPDLLARKEATVAKIAGNQGENSFFFFIALLLFLAAAAAYGGLLLLTNAETNTYNEITSKIQDKEKNLHPELIEKIFLLENRLKNIVNVLNQHTFTGNVFHFIETDTHPQVRFTSFSFIPGNFKVDMGGSALNYMVLARQINILEREPAISHVEFGGLSVGSNNLVGFHATLTFNPSILAARPGSAETPTQVQVQPQPQSQQNPLVPQTQP